MFALTCRLAQHIASKNELTLAEDNLSKALNLCRQINMVDHEANILLTWRGCLTLKARFQGRALEKASEALTITERSGYVLQGADVDLFLAHTRSSRRRTRPRRSNMPRKL